MCVCVCGVCVCVCVCVCVPAEHSLWTLLSSTNQGWKPPFSIDSEHFEFTPRLQPLNELDVSDEWITTCTQHYRNTGGDLFVCDTQHDGLWQEMYSMLGFPFLYDVINSKQ